MFGSYLSGMISCLLIPLNELNRSYQYNFLFAQQTELGIACICKRGLQILHCAKVLGLILQVLFKALQSFFNQKPALYKMLHLKRGAIDFRLKIIHITESKD